MKKIKAEAALGAIAKQGNAKRNLSELSGDSEDIEPKESRNEPEVLIMDKTSYPPTILEEKMDFLEKSVIQTQREVKHFADELVSNNLKGLKSIEDSLKQERRNNDQTTEDMKSVIGNLQESITKLNMELEKKMNSYTSELTQEMNRQGALLNTTIAHVAGIDEQLRNNFARNRNQGSPMSIQSTNENNSERRQLTEVLKAFPETKNIKTPIIHQKIGYISEIMLQNIAMSFNFLQTTHLN